MYSITKKMDATAEYLHGKNDQLLGQRVHWPIGAEAIIPGGQLHVAAFRRQKLLI
jgi:hypothetical protein